jgi:hypothetical protein
LESDSFKGQAEAGRKQYSKSQKNQLTTLYISYKKIIKQSADGSTCSTEH